MGLFRRVKYRASTVQLSKVDLDPKVQMSPSVGWSRLWMGGVLAYNVLKRLQEGLNKTGLNWHFGAETDLFNFWCNFCLPRPEGHVPYHW